MKRIKPAQNGFTIVELLIVIVVIGILAAITIVSFNGVQQRAGAAVLQSDLRSAATQLEIVSIDTGSYPGNTSELRKSEGTTFEYTNNGSSYCLTASSQVAQASYYFDSTEGAISEGSCPTHNGFLATIGPWTDIDAGMQYYACGIANGDAYCWGSALSGQLGNGSTSGSVLSPTLVEGLLTGRTVTDIETGERHTCAVADGDAFCWGAGANGALGNGSTDSSSVPVAVSMDGELAGKEVTKIGVGRYYNTCAIADGEVYCWGYRPSDGWGGGFEAYAQVNPWKVQTSGVLNGRTVTDVSVGYQHVCVVAGGEAFCWGYGANGVLGNGSTATQQHPVAVSTSGVLQGRTVTAVDTTDAHTCAIADSRAFCWGEQTAGEFGQGKLGDGTSNSSSVPVEVSVAGVLAGKDVTSISAGSRHSCAVADGEPVCWGNGSGVGLGAAAPFNTTVPLLMEHDGAMELRPMEQISAGNYMSCALGLQGDAYCWGTGTDGLLGNGQTGGSQVPVRVNDPS